MWTHKGTNLGPPILVSRSGLFMGSAPVSGFPSSLQQAEISTAEGLALRVGHLG